MKLKILHINDLHSRFEELSKLSTIIKERRDQNTIILDAGDNADFMRFETEGTKGEISSALLNEIGFDARVFGNNEGFSGIENGRVISKTSNCPVVTCNLYDAFDKKLDYLKDAAIINRNGLRILIIGVTAPYNEFYNLFGIYAKNPTEEVKRVLDEYCKEDYDLVLLLSHLGLKHDKEIATIIDGIDIIIGGHSHSILEDPIKVNNTIIHQAGDYGKYLGELEIEFEPKEKRIINFNGRIIDSSDYHMDQKILDLIKEYSIKADEYLGKPLYKIDNKLTHSLEKENEIGNLLADALMDVLGTDFGIINSGVLNKGIEIGDISKKLLLEVCPSPLNPTYIEVQGKDILISLEKSLLKEYCYNDGKGSGFRGKNLGNLQVSNNVKVNYNEENDDMNKILSITIHDQPLDHNKWYSVATSDYLQRGTGYTEFSSCKNEKYNPEYLREVLEDYMRKEKFINVAFNKRFISS